VALGALDIIIAADTAQLRKGMDTAVGIMQSSTKTMENVAKTAATAIAGYFTFSAIKDSVTYTLDLADSLGKLNQKVGISVDLLYSMQAQAKLSDVEFKTLEKSLLKFNKGLGTASMGGGDTTNALKNLNIELKDSSGYLKTSDQYLFEVADRFKGMPDGISKSTLAMQLFGKSGADMIPLLNGGSEAMKEFSGIMDVNTAKAAERLNDSFTRMGLAFEGNKTQILTGMLPAIESLSSTMEDFAKWTTANKDNIASFTDRAGTDLTALGLVGSDAFNLISDTSGDMLKIITSVFNEIPNLIGESSNDAINNFGFFEYFILGLSTATNGIGQFVANAKMAYATVAEYQAKYGSVGGLITNGGGRAASARLDYAYAKADADEATKNVVDTYNTLLGLKKQFIAKSNNITTPPPTNSDLVDYKAQASASKAKAKRELAEQEKYAKEIFALDQKNLGERENLWIKKFEDDLKSQKQYKDDIFQLTATDYEKTLKTIEDKSQLYRDGGRTEIEIANFVSLAKGDILEKEWAKYQKEMDDLDTQAKTHTKEFISLSEEISKIDIGGAMSFTPTGDTGIDRFASMLTSMGQINDMYLKQAEIEKQINLERQKIDEDTKLSMGKKIQLNEELNKKQNDLHANSLRNEMASAAHTIALSKNVFKEKSTVYKTLSTIEKALNIASLAMEAQKQIAILMTSATTVTASGIAVAANTTEAVSSAVVGVANQAKGDPYTAFPRIAAMIGLMGAVLAIGGIAFGGGSSASVSAPPPDASMGTVLGSGAYGQSESTTAITDLLSSIHVSEYSQLRDINRAVTSMSQNISSAITNIFRAGTFDTSGVKLITVENGITSSMAKVDSFFSKLSGGNIGFDPITSFANGLLASIGLGGSSKQYIAGSGFGISSGTLGSKQDASTLGAYKYLDVETASKNFWGSASYSHNITNTALDSASSQSIALIYKSFNDTMMSINKGLDANLSSAISGYQFNAISLNLNGLSSDDAIKKLNDTFSALGDTMANDVFGSILDQYQKLGEGMLETAVRVITEKEVLLQDLANVNKTITGDVISITQSLVDLSGGLTKFSDANSSYFDNYFTDAEKSATYQKNLSAVYSSMNLAMPSTVTGFRALVDSLDLNTLSGRETYTSLMNIADAQKTYIDSLKELSKISLANDMLLPKVSSVATNDGTAINNQLLVQVVKTLKSIRDNALYNISNPVGAF